MISARLIILTVLCMTLISAQTVRPVPRRGDIYATDVPKYRMTMKSNYVDKWGPVIKDKKEQFLDFIKAFKTRTKKPIYAEYMQFAKNYGQYYYYQNMVQEMNVISQLSGVPFEDIFLINFTYELFVGQGFAGCTSIVVQNDQGEVFLGRNLDFSLEEQYSKISIEFDYYDANGEYIYSTSQFVGYTITHTFMKKGAYAVSFNERSAGTRTNNKLQFLTGAYPDEYLMQQIARTANSYQEAVEVLLKQRIIAPCYYIICGINKNEGIVIERNDFLNSKSYELSDDVWFIVQTNVDSDKFDIDSRRTEASNRIKAIGKGITLQQLYTDVLTLYPNFNINTISTIMMNPKNGYINTTLWY